ACCCCRPARTCCAWCLRSTSPTATCAKAWTGCTRRCRPSEPEAQAESVAARRIATGAVGAAVGDPLLVQHVVDAGVELGLLRQRIDGRQVHGEQALGPEEAVVHPVAPGGVAGIGLVHPVQGGVGAPAAVAL